MENASKALIIAASVILGILLLTVLVYVFRAGGRLAVTYDASLSTSQLELYNSKFLQFVRNNNNVADIVSVCNLAYDTNSGSDYDNGWAVEIIVKDPTGKVVFKVPNTDPSTGTNKYNRNKILDGSNHIMSIYNLQEKTLGELGISGTDVDTSEYLTTSTIGNRWVKAEDDQFNKDEKDGEKGHWDQGVTLYKYEFQCEATSVQYNLVTGRVSSMVFTMHVSQDYMDYMEDISHPDCFGPVALK